MTFIFREEAPLSEVITYVKGTGKQNKAVYLVGAEPIPGAVITRLLTSLHELSGSKLDRAFYQGLEKYPKVLDSLDAHGIAPTAAASMFRKLHLENRPSPTQKSQRPSKVIRVAELVSKAICKKLKGTPTEIAEEFLGITNTVEFKAEVIDCIEAYYKNFGTNNLGFIKTNNRKGNPAAQKALAKKREEDKKKRTKK